MNCWRAIRRSSDYVDGRLRESERASLTAHLAECRNCALHVEHLQSVRSNLRDLPSPAMPANLRMALRVAASQERQAMAESLGGPWRRAVSAWCFRLNNLLRPVTVPATGGVLSTVVLFTALAFTIGTHQIRANQIGVGQDYEVPLSDSDNGVANLVPVQMRSSVLLTFSLDGSGQIIDYSVQDGANDFVGNAHRLQRSNIALPDFPSVLGLARPISRDISIQFDLIGYRQ